LEEGSTLKKWKLVLGAVILAIVLIAAGGFAVFRLYLVPHYIEPMLETMSGILKDEEIQAEISEAAKDLAQKGLIDSKLVDDYINSIQKPEDDSEESETENSNTNSDSYYDEENSVGAKNIKVQDGEEKKYGYGNSSNSLKESHQADNDVSNLLSESEKNLYDRIKSKVDAKDLSRAYELLDKIDMSRVRDLLSDRAALKEYITSVLSEEEYSEAMELYLKYAYLIQ
jgi:hypothetical protein